MNNLSNNIWHHYKYNLQNRVLTLAGLSNVCADFNNNVLKQIPANETIMVQMKIYLKDGTFKSVSKVELFTSTQSEQVVEFFTSNWSLKNEFYYHFQIHYVIISYKIIKQIGRRTNINKQQGKLLNIPIKKVISSNETVSSKGAGQDKYNPSFSFGGYSLPTTMDITLWGDCVFNNDYSKAIISKPNTKFKYEVILLEKTLSVNLLNSTGIIILSWKDSLINKNDLTYFTRVINNQEYVFDNNNIVVKMIQRKCETIKKGKGRFYSTNKFLTMDIETLIYYTNNNQKNNQNNNQIIRGEENINNDNSNQGTREDGQLLIPYCVSIFDGKNPKSFYLLDFLTNKNNNNKQITIMEEASQNLIEAALNSLMIRKYNGFKIYLHNFSYFDGIFMMKVITSIFPKVEPIIKDNQLIDVKAYYGKINKLNKYPYTLHFRDSFLLLPSSLEKLGQNFNVENKGYFPFEFVTNNIPLDYKGPVPEIKYFSKLNIEEYKNYCESLAVFSGQDNQNIWDLKKETIKYCQQDCLVLYQVISVFNKQIFQLFNLDVINSPTLSSLAMKIYKTKFMGDSKIPVILDSIYDDIKKAYTGGAVDVYKPFFGFNVSNSTISGSISSDRANDEVLTKLSETLEDKEKPKGYYYDVNSLYPFVMKNYPMPVGNPIFFEGDILNTPLQALNLIKLDSKPFGIFEVELESPTYLENPILQVKNKTDFGGFRTIAPLGTWKGWYFSEELYNAEKYGYKFEVLKGYTFNKGYIFKDYVEKLYSLKESHPKGSPMNLNAKLLLNSLYGRFGMSPHNDEHIVMPSHLSNQFILDDQFDILDVIDFKNNQELITYKKRNNPNIDNNIEENKYKNVSIVISSAITAYGRMHMSQFKNNPAIGDLLYSDTDCIAISGDLNPKYIGKGIGQMELEKQFIKVVYLAPKVYIGLMQNKLDSTKVEVHAVIKGINVEKKSKQFKFNDFVSLLNKDQTFKMEHDKWSRSIGDASVTIEPIDYNLIVTENKRKIIYNNNNTFVDTEPLTIEEE